MSCLRSSTLLVRWVLVWFALSLGAAIASPLLKPQPMELVCTGAGAMKVLVQTDEGSKEVAALSLDCPLCASNHSAPPPAPMDAQAAPTLALAYAMPVSCAADLAARSAAPPPPRGPPRFS